MALATTMSICSYVYLQPDKSRDEQFKLKLSLHDRPTEADADPVGAGSSAPVKKTSAQLVNDSAFFKAFALRFGSGRMATQACCVTLTSGASLAFRPSAACCLGFGKDGSTVYV